MSLAASLNKKYSYQDYLNWDDGERWELIDGKPYNMTPAPTRGHQEISRNLFRQIDAFLIDKDCETYYAPFDVRLPDADKDDDKIFSVVQPDILVVCDPDKLDDRGCLGAPDFIIEIISPGTAAKDQIQKVALYEKHGVKEYWLVHPIDRLVTIRRLGDDGRYGLPAIHDGKGRLEVLVLPGLVMNMDAVFQD